jgi:hypothetical protein
MPFSNALRIAFANNPATFLRDHRVSVNGSLGNVDAGGVNPLLNSMPGRGAAGPWNIGAGGIHTDLTAPQLFAYFNDAVPTAHHTMIPFAHDGVEIVFDAASPVNGVVGLPVSFIPYFTGRSYGARLPVDPNPAAPTDALAVTCTMDGCSLQISGSTEAPFVSHTNVADIAPGPGPTAWLERQGVMTARLLLTRVSLALNIAAAPGPLPVPGPNHINDPHYSPFSYGFWTNHYPQSPGYTVNYKENIQTALAAQMGFQGGRIWRGARDVGWLATDQYWLELIRDNLDGPPVGFFGGGVYQPMSPPTSVVGWEKAEEYLAILLSGMPDFEVLYHARNNHPLGYKPYLVNEPSRYSARQLRRHYNYELWTIMARALGFYFQNRRLTVSYGEIGEIA